MYRQVLVPDAQNATVTIPADWYGMEIVVLAYPLTVRQSKENRHLAWLNGNSGIDHPVRIGKNFRKISRNEIYDRRQTDNNESFYIRMM